MNDTTDKDGKKLGGTLTLKRPAVEQSRVKQSFSHGRTKTVVVETKRKRFGEETKPAAPAAEQRQGFQTKPKVAVQEIAPGTRQAPPSGPSPARPGVVLRTLTADEREARERALSDSRVREAQERKRQEEELVRRKTQEERDHIEREAAARRKAEDDARHQVEEQGRRKAEEAAKKLAPKGPVRDEDEEAETPRRNSGGVFRPGAGRLGASRIAKPARPTSPRRKTAAA
jgi:translation initiation factor IF-2